MSFKRATLESGYRHNRQPGQRQMDLFKSNQPDSVIGAPAWPELPTEARATLTGLMTQLILDHAAKTATPSAREAGHDL
jgi:hypothetical protein